MLTPFSFPDGFGPTAQAPPNVFASPFFAKGGPAAATPFFGLGDGVAAATPFGAKGGPAVATPFAAKGGPAAATPFGAVGGPAAATPFGAKGGPVGATPFGAKGLPFAKGLPVTPFKGFEPAAQFFPIKGAPIKGLPFKGLPFKGFPPFVDGFKDPCLCGPVPKKAKCIPCPAPGRVAPEDVQEVSNIGCPPDAVVRFANSIPRHRFKGCLRRCGIHDHRFPLQITSS